MSIIKKPVLKFSAIFKKSWKCENYNVNMGSTVSNLLTEGRSNGGELL